MSSQPYRQNRINEHTYGTIMRNTNWMNITTMAEPKKKGIQVDKAYLNYCKTKAFLASKPVIPGMNGITDVANISKMKLNTLVEKER